MGRLRLSPLRTEGSTRLDREPVEVSRGRTIQLPPYERWDRFYSEFQRTWGGPPPKGGQGQHITLVGTTGSGKTTLARELLKIRDYVIVLATKVRDTSLYEPLAEEGYVTLSSLEHVDPERTPRIIFKPPLNDPSRAGQEAQREAFREALVTVFAMGEWCLYADEVRYLTDHLGLKTELETLWLQGRSLGVSVVAATQRPVSIPLLAFDQADHLFLWRNADRESVRRMSEFAGQNGEVAFHTIPRLPPHEALYVNTRNDRMVRTKVE